MGRTAFSGHDRSEYMAKICLHTRATSHCQIVESTRAEARFQI